MPPSSHQTRKLRDPLSRRTQWEDRTAKKCSICFFQVTDVQHIASIRYLLSVLRVRALIDTTPPSDEHLILYFSIDSSTVRSRLEGGSREVRDMDAGGWGDEGVNVINYPSNDSDWWAAGQVQPGRNSVEMVMVTNKRWNRSDSCNFRIYLSQE